MRQIKFRQFINGEFWYWGYGVLPDPAEFVPPKDPSVPSDQFTGLCDKNGMNIYEADILRRQNFRYSDTGKKSSGFYLRVVTWRENASQTGFNIGKSWVEKYEIIGTIYEDPELLK